MSLFRIQSLAVVAWFSIMLTVIGTSVALGQPVTAAGMAVWILLAGIPPLVLLKVFRRTGPATMAKVMVQTPSTPPGGPDVPSLGSDRRGR